MSKRRKAISQVSSQAARRNGKFPSGTVLLVSLAAVVLLAIWLTRSRSPAAVEVQRTEPTNSPTALVENSSAPKTTPGFQALVGRWLRPDGGYVLEIKSVDSAGVMEAAYFNPNPIHVSKAATLRDGGVTKVYIELRDVNYPGSTYTLAYDPASDVLQGIYYQALERQNFEVAFQRMK